MDNVFLNARWISDDKTSPGKPIGTDMPSLRARRVFKLDKSPKEAVVSISGLGAFVLYLNGERVGDEYLSPAFTNYCEKVLYCQYDVTDKLKPGENVIAVEVGAGYYNQATYDGWSFAHSPWRDYEKLILALIADGEELLLSDGSFRVTRSGPRTNTQIRQGESFDARLSDGWLSPDFDDSAWKWASLTRIPGGDLVKQTLPPIRICEKIAPLSTIVCKNGIIYDFGRNISGVVSVKAKGKSGDLLSIKYGERIIDGELDDSICTKGVKNKELSSLEFGDRYVFSGDGVEKWQAEFVYYGFRYALVSTNAEIEEIEALFIHTDFTEKGGFCSSDETFNWLVSAGNTAFLSNFHGFSEDCPHREKNGWTGDAAISVDHAVYRYDMIESYRKWLGDITDCQLRSGQLPAIAPTGIYGYTWGPGPAWDHTLFYIPETVYRETGDDSLFDGVIEAGVKYFKYAEKYEDENGLVKFGLGDWCAPLDVSEEAAIRLMSEFSTAGIKKKTVATNKFSDSCYHYMNLLLFSKGLKRRGDKRAEEYLAHANRVLLGIRRSYLHDGTVDNDSVSALALALYFGIPEGEYATELVKRLCEKVEAGGYKMQCGILGTKALFHVLDDYGYTDVCHKMLRVSEYPSYGFWRRMGLMTFPELWEIAHESRNHHMYSDVVHWVYRNIGGIKNLGVAYDRCLIQPYLFSEECSAASYTETKRGKISVDWSYGKGEFNAEILIPEGTEATLSVKDKIIALKTGVNKITL